MMLSWMTLDYMMSRCLERLLSQDVKNKENPKMKILVGKYGSFISYSINLSLLKIEDIIIFLSGIC